MSEEIVTYQAAGFIAPVISVRDALSAYQAKKELIDGIMKRDVDFGVIPGSSKPTLLKAGAEKATSFFGLFPRFHDAGIVEDWTGEAHGGEPFFYYRRTCELWRNGQVVAAVDGSCNSWEKKYRYRSSERLCPSCGKATIIKGKQEYGGGFICFAKKGGCGAKFGDNDPAIVGQEVGQVKNPDVADIVNTILKMADKRALVAATLIATGLSEYFTQDIEDYVTGEVTEYQPQPAPAQTTKQATKTNRAEELEMHHNEQLDEMFPPSDAARVGPITQALVVELKLSENEFNALNMFKALKFVKSTPAAVALPIIRRYRANRDNGMTSEQAAENALAVK